MPLTNCCRRSILALTGTRRQDRVVASAISPRPLPKLLDSLALARNMLGQAV